MRLWKRSDLALALADISVTPPRPVKYSILMPSRNICQVVGVFEKSAGLSS